MKRLVIIACGSLKVWSRNPHAGPIPAQDAYISPYFRDNRRYAEAFGDRWLILSAKYGFIDPGFVIPGPYEVTFKRRSTHPVSDDVLAGQVQGERLNTYELVEVLGSSDYADRVRVAFRASRARVSAPLVGLSFGRGWQRVRRQLKAGRPFQG